MGRWNGYRRALAEAGEVDDEAYVRWGDHQPAGGYPMLLLLDLPQPPSAVFCCNDLTALGALTALRERGVAVPSGCSVLGYDDIVWRCIPCPH